MKKRVFSFLLCLFLLAGLLPTGVLTTPAGAEGLTEVDSIAITINEGNPGRSSVTYKCGETVCASNYFYFGNLNTSGSIPRFEIKVQYVAAYSFAETVSLTVNGAAISSSSSSCYYTKESSTLIYLYYTPAADYIDLYDGTEKPDGLAFGSVDKSGITSAEKTVTVKNTSSTAATGQLAVTFQAKSSGSGSASGGGSESGGGACPFRVDGQYYGTLASIAKGGQSSFKITIDPAVSAGNYEATMTIASTGMNGFNQTGYINKTYDLTLTVTESKKLTLYMDEAEQSVDTTVSFGTVDAASGFSRTFTLKNTGTEQIGSLEFSFSQGPSEVYAVSMPSGTFSLAPNESKTVTLTLKNGVAAGSYIHNNGGYYTLQYESMDSPGISGYLHFSITVTAQAAYGAAAYQGEQPLGETSTVNLGAAAEGYAVSGLSKTITVKNTGTNATGALTLTLDGIGKDAFVLSPSSLSSVAKNGETSFTVQPAAGLSPGSYNANLFVHNSNLSVGFKVSFTVQGVQTLTAVAAPGKAAPVIDAAGNTAGSSQTGYSISYAYEEKSGDSWVAATGSVFMAGKQYRLKVMAAVKSASYRFSEQTTMTIGGEPAENVLVNEAKTLVTGYKTYEPLGKKAYELSVTTDSAYYSAADSTLTFPDMNAGEVDTTGVVFTLTNTGAQATGVLTLDQWNIYNDQILSSRGNVFAINGSVPENNASYEIPSIQPGESYQLTLSVPENTETGGNPVYVSVQLHNSHIDHSFRAGCRVSEKQTREASLYYDHTILADSERICLDETASFVFDYNYLSWDKQAHYGLLTEGFSSADADRFLLELIYKNSGTETLSNIQISHSGDGDGAFVFSGYSESTASLSTKKTIGISVKPKTGTAAGTYKTRLIITADGIDPYVVSLTLTVHKRIDQVAVKGVTPPAEGGIPSRRIYTDTEGAYLRLFGWSRYDAGQGKWVGIAPGEVFRAGETYRLNLHIGARTGYRFKNHFDANDIPGADDSAQMRMANGIPAIEGYDSWNVLATQTHLEDDQYYTGNRFYYYVDFVIKTTVLTGRAAVGFEEYESAYVLNTICQINNPDADFSLNYQWYRNDTPIDGATNAQYVIQKADGLSGSYYCVITHKDREGSITSGSFSYDAAQQFAPGGDAVTVLDPTSCTGTGTVEWRRQNMEYRIAAAEDDTAQTYEDWQPAAVTAQESGGTGTGKGTGTGTVGKPGGYYGQLKDLPGGTVLWVRYRATDTKAAGEIGIYAVKKVEHLLNYHAAVIPDISCACEENGMEEYFRCSNCFRYFDADGNEFDSTYYFTTYAPGHRDEDEDLCCDYCGQSLVSRYFMKVTSAEELVTGAQYIIADGDGKVMGKIENINLNGAYVTAETVEQTEEDGAKDRYALFKARQTDAFIFRLRTIPSRSTAGGTCYGIYLNDCCVDITSGLVLDQQSWDSRTGISLTVGTGGAVTLRSWNGEKTLQAARLTEGNTPVFTTEAGSDGIGEGTAIYLYRLVEQGSTVDNQSYELTEKEAAADYDKLKTQLGGGGTACDAAAARSSVSGISEALDENYISFLTKGALKEEAEGKDTLALSVRAEVEVTEASADEITMDITPKLSCGDAEVEIRDKHLNGAGMLLTLYAGKAVPDTVTHHLESGIDEIFYKPGTPNLKSTDHTFRYETDANGDVYVTLLVTEFSEFTLSGSGIGGSGSGTGGGSGSGDPVCYAELKDGVLTVSCTLSSGYILAAEYSGGRLMHVQGQEISGTQQVYGFTVNDPTLEIRYFLLDDSYQPLSPAAAVG